MFSVLVIRLRSLRLLRVSGIVMRLRMFLLLITFLKASHSFRNRLLVICKNAYLFATMIMTSVSSPFSCCSGIVRFKLSKYNVDDVALGVCKTGAEEAGVTEVRTSLSEKKFELWREIKVCNMIKLLSRKPTALRLVNPSAAKIKIFTASAL